MTITVKPEHGEIPALYHLLEPLLPPVLHAPDSVVLSTDGFRLRWRKGPVALDATLILIADEGG